MKTLTAVFAVLLFLIAVGCSGDSGKITGSDSGQTIQQNVNHKPAAPGDPDDIIDGNKGGG